MKGFMKISVLLIHHLQHAQDVQNEIFDTNILLGGKLIRFLKIQKLNVNMNKKQWSFTILIKDNAMICCFEILYRG